MTEIKYRIMGRYVYVRLESHSHDHDVCTILSTLVNVLISACIRAGIQPKEYRPGLVFIEANNVSPYCMEVFETIYPVLLQVAEDNPDYVKLN